MNISDFTFEPKGIEGINQRMAAIRARSGFVDNEFANSMQNAAGMAANMDPSGQKAGGTNPMNPFDMDVSPAAAKMKDKVKIQAMVNDMAEKHGLAPDLLSAVIEQESNFDPFARSAAGAQGLMQLMPGTAAQLGVKDPYDPAQNIEGGAKYLRQLLDQFKDVPLALAAYNAGPTRVKLAGGIPNFPETRAYVQKIMARISQ